MGSVIQVMLRPRSYGIVGSNTNVIREAVERYGRERSVSSRWWEAMQAQWSSANGAVAYLLVADIDSGPRPIRLREVNQPVIITQTGVQDPVHAL